MAHIYEDSPDGKTLEIGNWKQHRPPRALMARFLTEDERQKYLDLKEAGFSDSGIWFALHPERAAVEEGGESAREEIALPVDGLSGEQMTAMLRMLLASELSSLGQASPEDLGAILKGLLGSDHVTIRL